MTETKIGDGHRVDRNRDTEAAEDDDYDDDEEEEEDRDPG